MKIPVAIYARVSNDNQVEGDSIDHQISLLTNHIQRNLGDNYYWDESLIYKDEGISGYYTTLMERPSIKKLFDDAQDGKFKVAVFKEISRIGRDSEENIKVPRVLESFGVRVIATNDLYDSIRSETHILFSLQSVLAEKESERISTRVSSGNREKARSGKWVGIPPLGYKLNSKTKKLEPDESKVDIPKIVFDLYVNKRYGGHKIAELLNEKGYKSAKGSLFNRKIIIDMLKNPVYIGQIVYGKTRTRMNRVYDENKNLIKKKKTYQEISDPIITKNAHPAIIDEKIFWRAQEILKTKVGIGGFSSKAKHPLVGIVYCDKCGKGLICNHRKANEEGKYTFRYYKCATSHSLGSKYCPPKNVNAEKLEKLMLDKLKYHFDTVLSKKSLKFIGEQEIDSYKKKIQKHNEEKKRLIKLQSQLSEDRDLYTSDVYRERMLALKSKIENVDGLIRITENQICEFMDRDASVSELAEVRSELDNIDMNDFEKLRALFLNYIDSIEVIDKNTIGKIKYRFSV